MRFFYLLPLLFLINACTTGDRMGQAHKIALDGAFSERKIVSPPFTLTTFEKITSRGAVAHIYIEGDGYAWRSRTEPSLDPTPKNPTALKLAKEDPAPNVIYLARPCQYSKQINGQNCTQKYWTSHRFAPEIITSMNGALNKIKADYNITGFHLIGFSGGANIATLLTAERTDVLSLRTIAGNLDHVLLHNIHGVSQTPRSLNAIDVAVQISHIPQHHFFGGKDKIISPEIIHHFIAVSGTQNCIRTTTLRDASHANGWEKEWVKLMLLPIGCRK